MKGFDRVRGLSDREVASRADEDALRTLIRDAHDELSSFELFESGDDRVRMQARDTREEPDVHVAEGREERFEDSLLIV